MSSDLQSLQVATLEGLSDMHSGTGDIGVAKDLAKRAVKIRQDMGDFGGAGQAQANLAKKVEQGFKEGAAVWSDL